MTDTSPEAVAALWDEYCEAGTTNGSTENGAIDLYDIDGMFDAARNLFDAGMTLSAQLAVEVAAHAETRAERDEARSAHDADQKAFLSVYARAEAAEGKIVQMTAAWGEDAVRVEELTVEVARLREAKIDVETAVSLAFATASEIAEAALINNPRHDTARAIIVPLLRARAEEAKP